MLPMSKTPVNVKHKGYMLYSLPCCIHTIFAKSRNVMNLQSESTGRSKCLIPPAKYVMVMLCVCRVLMRETANRLISKCHKFKNTEGKGN